MGDPIGATMNYRISPERAIDVSFGPDYFGSPRLQLDYVWVLNIFHSQITKAYAGPGLAIAMGKGVKTFFSHEPNLESFANEEDNGFGLGARTIFGITVTPKQSSFHYFLEGGPLLGFNRFMDLDLDGAIGVRYSL